MSEKVVVVGGGGREHALALALHRSPSVGRVFITAPNPGAEEFAERIAAESHSALADFCRREKVALVVVGPEAPLAAGMADDLSAAGVRVFGPTRAAARLESSKIWAKEFMRRRGIPTADFAVCESAADAEKWIGARRPPYVLKADGLAAGKGVAVCESADDARARAAKMLAGEFGGASRRILAEEFLGGDELSFIAVADGTRAIPLATSRDHKRLLDGDRGPNTGGMGAVSPAPGCDAALESALMRRVIQPALDGMAAEGFPYRGFLYAGIMRAGDGDAQIRDGGGGGGKKSSGTEDEGGRGGWEFSVLEFNCRMGDPEAQAVLPRLRGDFFAALFAAANGDLRGAELGWSDACAASVVVASAGYPSSPERGREIVLPEVGGDGVGGAGEYLFHAGTVRDASGRLLTNGGRVLCATALAGDLESARARATALAGGIQFEGAFFRRDIGV